MRPEELGLRQVDEWPDGGGSAYGDDGDDGRGLSAAIVWTFVLLLMLSLLAVWAGWLARGFVVLFNVGFNGWPWS